VTYPNQSETPAQRIMDGARQAFLAFGYDGAAMRTITEYTGYSQAGISHYFASKADLFSAVAEESFREVERAFALDGNSDPITSIFKIWRSLTRIRDHVAMRTVTIAEASVAGHPARDQAIASIHHMRDSLAARFPEIDHIDVFADIFRGLEKNWLYDAYLDGASILKDAYLALSGSSAKTAEPLTPDEISDDWEPEFEHLIDPFIDHDLDAHLEDERRQSILGAAMKVFGMRGYVGGSLRHIANELGVTHPALLRHYPSKDTLFRAVLERHDVGISPPRKSKGPRQALLRHIQRCIALEDVEGLIPLYTAIDARSFLPGTSYHDFFVKQGRQLMAVENHVFTGIHAIGQLRPDLNPLRQAEAYQALWDGVQTRWALHETESTYRPLSIYVDRILVPRLGNEELSTVKLTREDLHEASRK